MPRFRANRQTDNIKNMIRSSEPRGTINSEQENKAAGMEGRALGARNSSALDIKDGSSAIKLDLSNDNLLNGIILAELLGKPKSLKRGRW